MHPFLENLSLLTLPLVFDSEERCFSFFMDVGLFPKAEKNMVPNCSKCSCPMKIKHKPSRSRLPFIWSCRKCETSITPTSNTVFYGMKVNCYDTIIFIYCFVSNQSWNCVLSEIGRTRSFFSKPSISQPTVNAIFSLFRHICEIHTSHFKGCLGGKGERLKLEDMFLTTLSVNNHLCSSEFHVLGIYWASNKEGVFVEVDKDLNCDILSIICEYCHPETLIVPLNSMMINNGTGELIPMELCKNLADKNFIEKIDIEPLKKHLKNSFPFKLNKCLRDMSKTLYWRVRFNCKAVPDKMETFLHDTQLVFPGIFSEGLKLKSY